MSRKATIAGTGLYAPGRAIPNAEFNPRYGIDVDAFLVENRNIRERHFMGPDDATSDLVVPAARAALKAAGLKAADLDLIIVATDTPDYISPPTASVVQYKLGAKRAGIFDVNGACAGFVTALDMASKYVIADERYQAILVAGAYGISRYLDMDDYKLATLFADGAGAVIVRPAATGGVLAATLYADGSFHDYMGIYAGGTFQPVDENALSHKDNLLRLAKKFPAETNPTHWARLINVTLERIGKSGTDVAHFFFTQVSLASINRTLDILGVPHERSHNVMDRFAYTGSACIPMAMADAASKHRMKQGDLLVLLGAGGGLAMTALAMEWGFDT